MHHQYLKFTDISYCDAALLCKIAALRSFSLEWLQYKRERESGMSSLAYFLAKDTIDHFSTVVKPIVYLSMFYYFNNPRSTIADNYIVLLALVYSVTGMGYTFAICFNPGSAQLVWIMIIFSILADSIFCMLTLDLCSVLRFYQLSCPCCGLTQPLRCYSKTCATQNGHLKASSL